MVMAFYRETRPECRIESSFTSRKQKKMDCFNVDGYCHHCKTVFEAMGSYYKFCSCQDSCPSLTDQDFEQGNEKIEMVDMRRQYLNEKSYKIEETWESGGKVSKSMTRSKVRSEPTFLVKDLFLPPQFQQK